MFVLGFTNVVSFANFSNFKMIGILLIPALACGFQIGDYESTRMFQELQTCEEVNINQPLSSSVSRSLLDCCSLCSVTEDCRRIMFDRKTKTCSMFESGENCFHHENVEDKVCYRQKKLCSQNICTRCPVGYYGDQCQNIIKDCRDGTKRGMVGMRPAVTYIQPNIQGPVLRVTCNFKNSATIIQYRNKLCNEVDFNRSWNEYENGFGEVHGEYWLGLKHLKDIIDNYSSAILRIFFENWRIYYFKFDMSDDTDGYRFHFGQYKNSKINPTNMSLTSGTKNIKARPFSTYDRDYSNHSCPDRFGGGWWYLDDTDCFKANLNGKRNVQSLEAETHFYDDADTRRVTDTIQIRITAKN